MKFTTKHLVLRPWVESDAMWLYHYAKNPKIGPVAGWPPHESVEDSKQVIKTVFSKKETYAIVFNGKAIGCVGILLYPDGNHYWGEGNGELGYWIGEQFWGLGLVVEASKRLLEHVFKDLELTNVFATFKEGNNQSKRVLQKLGFDYYDELYNVDYRNRSFKEIVMYLKAEEYYFK